MRWIDGLPRWTALLLLLGGLLSYANSFEGIFVFDDGPHIVDNPLIRSAWPPHATGRSPHRILVSYSFALNYAACGLDRWGWHAVNLLIHVCAAAALAGLVRRVLQGPRLRQTFGGAAPWLGLGVGALWLAHPIQTQAVTYIVQRFESLAGLWILLSLYGYVRFAGAATPRAARGWGGASVGAAVLGMLSKETALVLPLAAVLLDRTTLATSWGEVARRRGPLLVLLCATLTIPFLLRPLLPAEVEHVARAGGALGIGRGLYLLTQAGVVTHYLRLVLWPVGLCFDYGWSPVRSMGQWLGPVALLGTILSLGLIGLCRGRPAAFPVLWFFLLLAPTSSVVPLDDLAAEHRVYLALCGPVALLVVGGYRALVPRGPRAVALGACALACVVLAAGMATWQRNAVYASAESLWRDVLRQRPANARAYLGYGTALLAAGRASEGEQVMTAGLALLPEAREVVYTQESRGRLSHRERLAVTLHTQLRRSLAAVRLAAGDPSAAVDHLAASLRVYPGDRDARNQHGAALFLLGQRDEAEGEWLRLLEQHPDDAAALFYLGNLANSRGEYPEAIARYDAALRAQPDHEPTLRDLAWLLATCAEDAVRDGRRAIALAERASALSGGRDARALDAAAAAHAEVGDFARAQLRVAEALRCVPPGSPMAATLRDRAARYADGKPYRELPR